MKEFELQKIDFQKHKDQIIDVLEMLMCEVKETDEHLYKHIKGELYEMVHGKHITHSIAEEWVESMHPVGQYWSMQDTTKVMYELGFNHDEVEFYVVANMLKNDYNNVLDDGMILNLAHYWLDDKDAKDDKLYEYWKHIVKVK